MTAAKRIRLGLIGDNINRSRSPQLHRLAGEMCGLDVSYDLLVPAGIGKDFDAVFDACMAGGMRGLNITYPYKERVVARVEIADPLIARIGSVNTVLFDRGKAFGHNTDHSGFIAAFRLRFGDRKPGIVAMVGAGGVGKAVAFGLLALGAAQIRIVERDIAKAQALAVSLGQAGQGALEASVHGEPKSAVTGADGVINCTPVGMIGYPGTPVSAGLLDPGMWAFDVVYTPVQTQFKTDAEAKGLSFLSGYELYFHQGIQAFRIFTGRMPDDLDKLRANLLAAPVPGTA